MVAVSAAYVGTRAPSWNHEPGKGTDLVNAPTMLGPSAIALRVQMGRDERRSVSLYGPAARSSDQNVVRRDLEQLAARSLKEETARAPALALAAELLSVVASRRGFQPESSDEEPE